MPPKPSSSSAKGPSKKTEMKKKEKVIEDKTFGLKNKKGAKQQKFIQQVEKQVKSGGANPIRKVDPLEAKKKTDGTDDITAQIFKPVQKVEKGADPKSILCAFHKQGQCAKGDKCKFSHDLGIERKAEKRSLYCDLRENENNENDTMDLWDEDKLKDVVEKKHGALNTTKTDIICKYFLEAVEKSKYGWFWECPNGGGNCMYRHALPPGFVLKKDKQKNTENKVSLEEWIETERHKLSSKNLTPVNIDTFVAWKKRKILEKKENLKLAEDKKFIDFQAGNKIGLSGREMFTFNPELAAQNDEDEDEEQTFDMKIENDENDEIEYKEINFEDYANFETQKEIAVEKLSNLEIDEDLFDEELFDDE